VTIDSFLSLEITITYVVAKVILQSSTACHKYGDVLTIVHRGPRYDITVFPTPLVGRRDERGE